MAGLRLNNGSAKPLHAPPDERERRSLDGAASAGRAGAAGLAEIDGAAVLHGVRTVAVRVSIAQRRPGAAATGLTPERERERTGNGAQLEAVQGFAMQDELP